MAIPPEGVLVGEKDIVHHLSEINCIKKNAGGGYKYAHPFAFWENQMKTAAKLLQTRQFIQLTRIKSWDNIEKIGIIPTDYKKLVEDKR